MARPDLTGRKMATKLSDDKFDIEHFYKQHSNLDAYSIDEFCRRHGISVQFYYKLREKDPPETPREMTAGARVMVSKESAADWRREREAAAAKKREAEKVTT